VDRRIKPRSSRPLQRPMTSRVKRRLRSSRPWNVAGRRSFFLGVVTAPTDRLPRVVTWRGDVIQVSSVDWSLPEPLPAFVLRLRTRTPIRAASPNPFVEKGSNPTSAISPPYPRLASRVCRSLTSSEKA